MNIEERKSQLFSKLQKAVELELSTIPPYLMAMWSIKPDTNIDSSVIIRSVLMEEMLHLTLAANILSAVGGKVQLEKDNLPSYPLKLEFQGKRFHNREVDIHLGAFTKPAVVTFMQIELPDSFAAASGAAKRPELDVPGFTIGDFYKGIRQDLARLCEEYGDKAVFTGDSSHQISEQYYWRGGGRPVAVTHLKAAEEAIAIITDQGEGADGSLFDGDNAFFGQPEEVAHYFRFNEIFLGRYYGKDDRIHDLPSGEALPVNYHDVFPIKPDLKSADYDTAPQLKALNDTFNAGYSLMLSQLMEGFGGNPAVFYTAIMNGMRGLTSVAQRMVQIPIDGDSEGRTGSPTFEWKSPGLESMA